MVTTLLFLLVIADNVVQRVQSVAEDFRVRPDGFHSKNVNSNVLQLRLEEMM